METEILSPEKLKTKIEQQIALSIIKERKGLSLSRISKSYNQHIQSHVIKRRIFPPYIYRVLVIYHDLPGNDIVNRMIEFAKLIEENGWHVFLKHEKLANAPHSNINYNLKVKLCEDELPAKYYSFVFTISSKQVEKPFEKATYKTPTRKITRKDSLNKISQEEGS